MSRVLLALLAALALTTAVAWYALSLEPQRPAPAPAGARRSAPASEAPGADPRAADAAPVHAATPDGAPAVDARAAVPSAREEALANARWVEGRVVFPPGTPADEELFVVADGRDLDDGQDHRARVERDGRFRVAFSERTRTGVLRLEGRYLFLREPVRWKRDQEQPVRLEPELGGRIAVSLVPPLGVAAADVRGRMQLSFVEYGGSLVYFGAEGSREEPVEATLSIAFDAVDPQRELQLVFDGEDFVAEIATCTVDPGRTASVPIELVPGARLSGVVRDASGAPVADARVNARTDDELTSGLSGRFRHVSTEDDGTFRLGALPAGRVRMTVRHDDFEPLEHELEALPGSGTQELELVLLRGSSIAGRVRWPDGTPAKAQVKLEQHVSETGNPFQFQEKEVSSEDDGSFAFSGLTGTRYRVQVSGTHVTEELETSPITGRERTRKRRARWVAELTDVAVGARGLELVLSPGLSVRGRVVDAEGRPMDDVYVLAERAEPSRGRDDGQLAPSGRFRDEGGAFELTGFLPGEWVLRARAKGHSESDGVQVLLPTDAPVELRLEREAIVAGVVLGLDGRPAAGALVTVMQPGHDELSWRSAAPSSDETDSEGGFRVRGLHGGVTRLVTLSPAGVPGETLELELVPGETREGLVLSLQEGCTLEGEVVDHAGRPEVGLFVQLNLDTGDFHRSLQTDQDGRFQARGLPAGEGNLFAHNRDGLTLHERFELRPGAVTRVRLAAPQGALVRVHGRLLAGGEPLPDAWVFARRESVDPTQPVVPASVQALQRSGADGLYELRLTGAGRWLVSVHDSRSGNLGWTIPLEVPEVESYERDLVLGLGHVRGRVQSRAGQPLEGVRVRSEPRNHDGGPRGQASTLTGVDGRYELAVPEGRHALVAGGDPGWGSESEWCAARVEDLRVEDGASLEGVDFDLDPGASLSGSVRAPDGGPARFAALWSCGPSGVELLGHADQEGGFQLSGLREGNLWVRAHTGSAATPSATLVSVRRGAATRVDLQLVAGVLLHVRVLDDAGAPLGSELEVLDRDGRPVPAVASGELGEATFGPLTPGSYHITARRESKVTERTLEVSGLEEGLELVLGFE